MEIIDYIVAGEDKAIIIPQTTEYSVAFLELCRRSSDDISSDAMPAYFVDSVNAADKLVEQSAELGQDRYLVLSRGVVAGSVEVSDIIPTLRSTKEISIFMDSSYRGTGIGTAVIDTLSSYYLDKQDVIEIVAFTRDINVGCIKALEKAHFSRTSEVAGDYLRYSRY